VNAPSDGASPPSRAAPLRPISTSARHASQRLHRRALTRRTSPSTASASLTWARATTWSAPHDRARRGAGACSCRATSIPRPPRARHHALRAGAARAGPRHHHSLRRHLQFWELGGARAFTAVADALARSPVKFYWMIRPHAQSRTIDEAGGSRCATSPAPSRIRSAVAAGEVTAGPTCTPAIQILIARLDLALARGQPRRGPTAGASRRSSRPSPPAASAPTTSRSRRARSSTAPGWGSRSCSASPRCVRPQRPARRAEGGARSRRARDAHGRRLDCRPFVLEHGFVDHLIRTAMQRGVPPLDAYRMATLNPATLLRQGRRPRRHRARPLRGPLPAARPQRAAAGDRRRARARGRARRPDARADPEPSWRRVFSTPAARLTARWRARTPTSGSPAADVSRLRLVSAVITKVEEARAAAGDLHAALVDRRGRWVAPALVAGFADRLDGLATTISTDFNILTLGRRPESMARASTGCSSFTAASCWWTATTLPGSCRCARRHHDARRAAGGRAPRARAVPAPHRSRLLVPRPFFTMLFLSADFLPAARLTPLGVWDVKAAACCCRRAEKV